MTKIFCDRCEQEMGRCGVSRQMPAMFEYGFYKVEVKAEKDLCSKCISDIIDRRPSPVKGDLQ
jgi:hypothetical protein